MTKEQMNFIIKDKTKIRETIASFTSTSGFLIYPTTYDKVELDDTNELLVCTVTKPKENEYKELMELVYYHTYTDIIAITVSDYNDVTSDQSKN